jgi:Flp pilus assembly protein TadD
LVQSALKRDEPAMRDYDKALELEPNFASAALNRGILHYQAGKYQTALDDMTRALADGANPAAAHYNLALVHQKRGDRAKARTHVDEALRNEPEHEGARSLKRDLQSMKDS